MPRMHDLVAEPRSSPPLAEQRPHVIASPHGARTDEYYWLRDDTAATQVLASHGENAWRKAASAPAAAQRAALPGVSRRIARRTPRSRIESVVTGTTAVSRRATSTRLCAARGRAGCAGAGPARSARTRLGYEFYDLGGFDVSRDERLLAWTEDTVGRREYTLRFRVWLRAACSRHDHRRRIAGGLDRRPPSVLYIEKDPQTCSAFASGGTCSGRRRRTTRSCTRRTTRRSTPGSTSARTSAICSSARRARDHELRFARADDPALRFEVLLPRERDHEYEAEPFGGRWIIRTTAERPTSASSRPDSHGPRTRHLAGADRASRRCKHRGLRRVRHLPRGRGAIRRAAPSAAPRLGRRQRPVHRVGRARVPDGARRERGNGQPARPVRLYVATTPSSTYDFDLDTGRTTLLKREPVLGDFDPANYVTECVRASARDGEQVPVALVYRRGCARDGTAPLLQYGYGAYGLSSDPYFSSTAPVAARPRLRLRHRPGARRAGARPTLVRPGSAARQAQQLQRFHRRDALAGQGAVRGSVARGGDRRQRRRPARGRRRQSRAPRTTARSWRTCRSSTS